MAGVLIGPICTRGGPDVWFCSYCWRSASGYHLCRVCRRHVCERCCVECAYHEYYALRPGGIRIDGVPWPACLDDPRHYWICRRHTVCHRCPGPPAG